MERRKERDRERGWQGWANKTQGLFFFFFFKHEIVSVLLKCMFEVGAQLNTSCLKKTDARVEQEMRERAKKEGGGWGSREDRKRSMRKKKKKRRAGEIYGKSTRLCCKTRKTDGERQKGGLQWCKVDVATGNRYAGNMK